MQALCAPLVKTPTCGSSICVPDSPEKRGRPIIETSIHCNPFNHRSPDPTLRSIDSTYATLRPDVQAFRRSAHGLVGWRIRPGGAQFQPMPVWTASHTAVTWRGLIDKNLVKFWFYYTATAKNVCQAASCAERLGARGVSIIGLPTDDTPSRRLAAWPSHPSDSGGAPGACGPLRPHL